jgi:hypothetical protein
MKRRNEKSSEKSHFDSAMPSAAVSKGVANPFKSSRWRCRQTSSFFVLNSVLLVVYVMLRLHRFAVLEHRDISRASSIRGATMATESPLLSFVAGGIHVNRQTIDGKDVMWASPRDNPNFGYGDRSVKGLLFLAHGCHHSHTDWFAKTSPECEECLGLPEEIAIVETALDLGLVAIAMSSSDRNSKCWKKYDTTPVALVLNELSARFSQAEALATSSPTVPRLPLYAFGASSGGSFVSSLAGPLWSRFGIRLDGFVSQISARLPTKKEDAMENDLHNLCRVYLTMDRDAKQDRAARARVEKCNKGSQKERCKHIRLPPHNVGPSYFADRIHGVTLSESEELKKVLTEAGVLNRNTGQVLEDPRKTYKQWGVALQAATVSSSSSELQFTQRGDYLVADESPISEVLNVAWGYHEMSRDGVREALDFCRSLLPESTQFGLQ